MEVQLTPAYMDKTLFLRLAKDYVDTLSQYDRQIRWDELSWGGSLLKDEFIMEDRTVQGFVITETVQFDFYPPILYITELYVVPEARKRGVGLATVKELMKKWNGDVYLYILDRNTEARIFWNVVEAELGWKRINRSEIQQEEGCELRIYQTE